MSDDRKIPCDLDAETSLLGAMLLGSPDAIRIGLEALDPADWYHPAHRKIFAAIAALNALERPIDPVTVGGELGDDLRPVGGMKALRKIQAATPASANAAQYARLVAETAARRRAIQYAGELADAAYGSDQEALAQVVREGDARLATPASIVEQPAVDIGDYLAQANPEAQASSWAIRDILDRGECVLITGSEGAGKSALMRQLAIQTAIGRHPFQRTSEPPRRVLYVDLQDPPKQIRHEFGKFLDGPGKAYERGSGLLVVKSRPQGIDLTTARDARWLDALVAHHDPALVCLGPLYRAYRGSETAGKSSEEAADIVTDVFARLMVRRDCALILEGHTIHDGEKVGYRPRGSRLWEGWPTFGFGLAPVSRKHSEQDEEGHDQSAAGKKLPDKFLVKAWRGMRDRDRPWPASLLAVGFEGGGWPWVPPKQDPSTNDTSVGLAGEIF